VTGSQVSQDDIVPLEVRYPRVIATTNTGLLLFFGLTVALLITLAWGRRRGEPLPRKHDPESIALLEEEMMAHVKKTPTIKKKSPTKKSAPPGTPSAKQSSITPKNPK